LENEESQESEEMAMVSGDMDDEPPPTEIVPAPSLTLDQCHGLLRDFLEAYKSKDFQIELRKALRQAGGDMVEEVKRRQEVCLPRQCPVLERYGFQGNKTGVQDAVKATSALGAQYTQAMNTLHFQLQWIIDPKQQEAFPEFVPDMYIPLPEETDPGFTDSAPGVPETGMQGSTYLVVGGSKSGGVVARRGAALDSPAFPFRLSWGAKVLALDDPVDGRLHYRRLTSEGPDFGWVSLEAKGRQLLRAL